MTSLLVDGHELLVTEGYGPIRWGCYPMAPWAGRIRDGRFTFRGRDVQLALNMAPHAIHGTVFERAWETVGSDTLTIDLGPDWPWRGRVIQRFALRDDGLRVELELEAEEPMPAVLGWHPWFRRTVGGSPIELRFEPGRMLERGPDGLPTGALVKPKPRPWDDCFVEMVGMPAVSWAGILRLEITSSADHWVVYDESEDGVCVEPQTGPPDAVNLGGATVVEPGAPLVAWMDWRWDRPVSASS